MAAVHAAMTYLHQHAGYTRVHNPRTGNKDLQRLPGLVGIAYQHETSRCGDPHLHTHVIVPNRQPRADGHLVSLDSKSLHHEAKAAGIIYQAVLRHELHTERGFEWADVDEHSGMAEIAGVTKACIKAWSQRSTRLREWARNNLVVVDGEPTAAQLATAQKATRPVKPESLAWAELKEQWRADARGLQLDRAAHFDARRARRARRCAARRVRAPRWTARGWRAWPRASTRPRSPARTWSSWSARSCPSTRPAIRAPSSSRSSTWSACGSARRAPRTTAKGTKSSPSTR